MSFLVWLNNHMVPVAVWLMLFAVPLGAISIFSRKARLFLGKYMYYLSFLVGLSVWMLGALYVLSLWGLAGLMVGLFLGGIGVVPLGLIATAIHGHWGDFFSLFLELVVLLVFRLGGLALIGTELNRREEEEAAAAAFRIP